jgi:hypothetical protein
LWVNWTRANLGTINVVEGENVIKFVFKNDNKLSNQYDTNAIGSYDYIELNSQPDHVLESKFDEEYHWTTIKNQYYDTYNFLKSLADRRATISEY